jgi:hypothetical protein
MAPEVFDGERSVQSDLWSVGVILYQMLSGRLPFPQSDLMALLGAIIKNDSEPLPNYVPFALAQIVGHSLQKNPTKRYQSVVEMRAALQAITNSGDIVPTTLRMLDDKPTLLDEKPTLAVESAQRTNPEQTAATLSELALKNNSHLSQQNRTVEQVPALATQQVTQEVSQSVPITEKIPLLSLEYESDKPKGLSKPATATRVAVFVVLFLVCWAGLSQLPGSFGKFFPFPFLSQKNNPTANNIDKNTSNLSNQSKLATPKADIVKTDVTVIKDSNKLAMEIGKRIALLEDAIPKLPKAKETLELQEAFEGIRDGFEEISSEDIKPETLKPLYEGYIVGLDSLMISVENLKLGVKPKVKTPPTPSSETAVSKPPLPPSPNIPLPDQKENVIVEFGKPLEIQQSELPIPLSERLKELRRKTKEMRQMHKEALRQSKEKQMEQLEDPSPRRFMSKKAIREEEKEEKRERKSERKSERRMYGLEKRSE